MIQQADFTTIPAAAARSVRYGNSWADINYNARVFYDDEGTTTRPLVITLHGSGGSSNNFPSASSNDVEALLSRGFNVLSFRYGNANGPSVSAPGSEPLQSYMAIRATSYFHAYCHSAWVLQAALEFWNSSVRGVYCPNDAQVAVYGHSLGAQVFCGWSMLAGTPGFYDPAVVRCAFANAPTGGGLGGGTWYQPWRLIGCTSQALLLGKHPVVLGFADRDDFAPPDMSKRYLLALRGDPRVRFYSPPTSGASSAGHNWVTFDATNAGRMADQLLALWNETLPSALTI